MSGAVESVVLYTDGAARGNPGPAGAGVRVESPDGSAIDELAEYIGEATNNVAEYQALLIGLERARSLGAARVEVRSDSELLVRQMTGEYKVKNAGLRELVSRARVLERAFRSVAYVHVRREKNQAADRLANLAIDRAR